MGISVTEYKSHRIGIDSDKRNLYSLELYLPDASTVEMLKSLPENTTVMISLWLFLDDGSFFIIFPDEVNPYFDENRMITFYRISFSRAGFHSERKNLKDVFTSEEICNFLRRSLPLMTLSRYSRESPWHNRRRRRLPVNRNQLTNRRVYSQSH